MATPTTFPESNSALLGGPAENFGTDLDVVDLPVFRDGQQIISCWSLTWRERLSALFSGRVWLFVQSATTAPAIAVAVGKTVFAQDES